MYFYCKTITNQNLNHPHRRYHIHRGVETQTTILKNTSKPKQLKYMKRGNQNFTLQRDPKRTATNWELSVFKTKEKKDNQAFKVFQASCQYLFLD